VRSEDLGLIEWAEPEQRRVHVLLAKADKLNQAERGAALREARAQLADVASVQLFSAHSGLGVEEARDRLAALWAGERPTAE
jgi:GTP-binding protein